MKKITLIGLGRFGKKLFERFNEHGQVKYVCEREISKKLLDLKEKFGVRISDNFEETLDEVDLAVIATPANSHYSITKTCLLKGKDVFVEKPICTSIEEAEELFRIAKEKNLNLYVDNVFLYEPGYQELKKNVSGEKINEVKFIWKKYGTFDDSILNNLVYHNLYLLIDLLGEKEIEGLEIIKSEDPLEKGRIDVLEFRFNYGGTLVSLVYNRTSNTNEKSFEVTIEGNKEPILWKNKQIIVNENTIEIESTDPLSDMIHDVLEDQVDYNKNNYLALKSLEYLEKIEQAIEKSM